MFRRFSVNFALFSIILDTVVVIASLAASVSLRPLLNQLPYVAHVFDVNNIPKPIYFLFPLLWVSIFLLLSVYDGRKNFKVVDEFSSITLGSILAAVSMAGTLYLSYREISRILFLIFVLLSYLMMLSWRMLARLQFRLSSSMPGSQRRVLIIGAGQLGQQMREQIQKNWYLGLTVIGFLDDDPNKRKTDEDILGSVDDICKVVAEQEINDVVVALPNRAHRRIGQLVAKLHLLPVKVWLIPDYFHLALHKAVVEEFAGIPLLDLRAPALNDYQRMIKRAFDLTLTFLIILPVLPIMGIIALCIRLEGAGPILFRQMRVGENGRMFGMLKFRTMVPNAEQLRHLVEHYDAEGHLIHKTDKDPRVTKVGHFLRRTSLDELPQLFNVLKGEMSLIGPRPELPYLVNSYELWQHKRFSVPQGITGWWQVNGRSDKPMHLHTEDDLYYVQNYSLLLDIIILVKTIGVVLRGKGAF